MSEQLVKMEKCLSELGVPLKLEWSPKPSSKVHGEIKGATIYIYDVNPEDAWSTFLHEIIEFKLKDLTSVYRALINKLIEAIEAITYKQKEEFINFIPSILEAFEKNKGG